MPRYVGWAASPSSASCSLPTSCALRQFAEPNQETAKRNPLMHPDASGRVPEPYSIPDLACTNPLGRHWQCDCWIREPEAGVRRA
eukprot:4419725-Amphidinium_carterae.1